MQTDWALVERLAPSLAWPIVALIMFLIGLIVLHGRLGDLTKAILALHDLPKALRETMSEHQRLSQSIKDEMRNVNALATVVGELTKLRNELQTDALENESKSIETQIEVPDVSALDAEKNTNDMYVTALGKWTMFTQTLENRLKEANIDFDMRRVGRAAYALTDRRRRNPLTREEADLITNLARQARRFTRLSETKDDWLTPEVYLRFVTGVDVAVRAITRTKAAGG